MNCIEMLSLEKSFLVPASLVYKEESWATAINFEKTWFDMNKQQKDTCLVWKDSLKNHSAMIVFQ